MSASVKRFRVSWRVDRLRRSLRVVKAGPEVTSTGSGIRGGMGLHSARQVTVRVRPSKTDRGSEGPGFNQRVPRGAKSIYQVAVTAAPICSSRVATTTTSARRQTAQGHVRPSFEPGRPGRTAAHSPPGAYKEAYSRAAPEVKCYNG